MKNLNLENVQEAQVFKKVLAGAYICRLIKVTDANEKEYLKIEYDIVDGEFKDYYRKLYESKGFWGASFIKSYKETALPFFKGFITATEKSNKGYKFNYDETTLDGKLVGLVLGEEEYTKNDGSLGTRLYVDSVRSIEEIKKGVEIPEIKKLTKTLTPADYFGGEDMVEEDGMEIPF